MNITADQIRDSCVKSQALDKYFTRYIGLFEDTIRKRGENGFISAKINVTGRFGIANMPDNIAQAVLYSRLIKECEDKKFTVYTEQNEDTTTTFTVHWGSNLRGNWGDIKQMEKYVNSHSVKYIKKKNKPRR